VKYTKYGKTLQILIIISVLISLIIALPLTAYASDLPSGSGSKGSGNAPPTEDIDVSPKHQTWKGSGNITVTANGVYPSGFSSLRESWFHVPNDYYTVESGNSTRITIYESYLNTLPDGTYGFHALFGTRAALFWITIDRTYVPRTGDDQSILFWVIVLSVSTIGVIGTIVWRYKIHKKESI